jgi:hypothetical protein
VTQWQAMGLYKYGYPGDTQIAASSTHIVVTNRRGISFYDKSGALLKTIKQQDFFPPAVGTVNPTYPVDRYNDLRTIFDPFRKRFWIVALGIHNDYKNIPKAQRSSVVAAFVSVDENPLNGFHPYWWPGAAPVDKTDDVGGLPDYPTVGVDQTAVYVTHGVGGDKPYWRVSLAPAAPMAAGQAGPLAGWQFWDLKNPNGQNAGVVQPAIMHGASPRMFFASTQDTGNFIVWSLEDPLGPNQKMTNAAVTIGTDLAYPVDASENGGGTTMLGLTNLDIQVVKAVWRSGKLWLVASESHSGNVSTLTDVRLAKLNVSGYPSVSGATKRISSTVLHYSWPAVEVNAAGDVAVVHQGLSPNIYPGVRYTAWLHAEAAPRSQRLLKQGDAAYQPNGGKTYLFGDIAGASVDYVNGKEATGIWIANQYAGSDGDYAIWVAKVFGTSFADLFVGAEAVVSKLALAPGECFDVTSRVGNQGDRRSAKTDVAVLLNGVPLVRKALPPLRPRRRLPLRLHACVPPGTGGGKARVTLASDASKLVPEYDERNNDVSRNVTIVVPPPPTTTTAPATTTVATTTTTTPTTTTPVALPDLVIVRMSTSSYTVRNVGGSAAGHFVVSVSGVGTFGHGGLDAGESDTQAFTSPCSRTVPSVTATADARNEVTESDEGNNSATARC